MVFSASSCDIASPHRDLHRSSDPTTILPAGLAQHATFHEASFGADQKHDSAACDAGCKGKCICAPPWAHRTSVFGEFLYLGPVIRKSLSPFPSTARFPSDRLAFWTKTTRVVFGLASAIVWMSVRAWWRRTPSLKAVRSTSLIPTRRERCAAFCCTPPLRTSSPLAGTTTSISS
jgi:hypothetical protein